jgi:hypothetical protein
VGAEDKRNDDAATNCDVEGVRGWRDMFDWPGKDALRPRALSAVQTNRLDGKRFTRRTMWFLRNSKIVYASLGIGKKYIGLSGTQTD